MTTWQPIETAPKDGTRIIVCDEYGVPTFASWFDSDNRPMGSGPGFRCQMNLPTWCPQWWYPLPPAPNE